MRVDPKIKAVRERIMYLEKDIVRAKEYLESGKHARWEGFSPLFVHKLKDGKELPPHRDWVRNVFLKHVERSLDRSQKLLERLESRPSKQKSSIRSSLRKIRE